MKVVLRHTITGRYYQSPGKWVRRADNALVFEDAQGARQYARTERLPHSQPVQRLAPYLMPLLRRQSPSVWKVWRLRSVGQWYNARVGKFTRN